MKKQKKKKLKSIHRVTHLKGKKNDARTRYNRRKNEEHKRGAKVEAGERRM